MLSVVKMQSVDISKYTDDDYENHLTDPVSALPTEEHSFFLWLMLTWLIPNL